MSSVCAARKQANTMMTAWGASEETAYAVELVTSELVSNAVNHGADRRQTGWSVADAIELSLHLTPCGIRVEVSDGSEAPPMVLDNDTWAESGRGLQIVTTLSQRWGYSARRDGGKEVWALV
jgi:anti-sigma regulatory factor (Ser/Thr protein kinase)